MTLTRLAAACLAALVAAPALAGSCPADQYLKEPRQLEEAPDVGVKRPIIAAVPLKGWRGFGDFTLRLRRLTVLPGGTVPTHWHTDRPSIVYVLDGEIWEHSNHCAVPILHKGGEWTEEFGDFRAYWWINKTDKPVVLLSTDVVPWIDTEKEESSPKDPGM